MNKKNGPKQINARAPPATNTPPATNAPPATNTPPATNASAPAPASALAPTNAPIDINANAVEGTCQQKCQLMCKYRSCPGTVRVAQNHLSISHEVLADAPMEYNGFEYQVSEVRMYIPSIHTWNGKAADAELCIVHYSMQGGGAVYICLPIMANNGSSASSAYFSGMVQVMSQFALSTNADDTAVLPSPLNLSAFVPNAPFYQYRATQMFDPFQDEVDYIVFSPDDAPLFIRPEDFAVFAQIVGKHSYIIHTGPTLFKNPVGMIVRQHGEDEIYIDCQPVGESDDTTLVYSVNTSSSSSPSPWESFLSVVNSPIFQAIFGVIFFFGLLYLIYVLYRVLDGKAAFKKGVSSGSSPLRITSSVK